MSTIAERDANTADLLTATGRLDRNATPAERAAAVQALTDGEIFDRSVELLARLGAPGYHHPAAA